MTHGVSKRLVGAGFLAALGLLHGSPVVFGQASQTPSNAVQAILERSRGEPSESPSVTALDLAGLGSGAIPAILEALADPRSETLRELLFDALEYLPIQALRSHVVRRARESIGDDERGVSIEALGRRGMAPDLEIMILMASGASALGHADRVPMALEQAAEQLLLRDKAAYAQVGQSLPRAREELRAPLFGAIDRRSTEAGLRLLADVAREHASLAPQSLAHLSRTGSRTRRPVDDEVLSIVRAILAVSSSPALPEAVLAAGFLDDYRAIPRLIELVDDPRPGIRRNAEWSLRTLSGLGLLGGSDRWKAWYLAEETWRQGEMPGIERALASSDPGKVTLALEEIAGKRCYRHDLARRVARLLDDPDPEIVALACGTLRYLGSTAVLEALSACTTHESPAVRAAARSALAVIRGEEPTPGRTSRRSARRRDPGAS